MSALRRELGLQGLLRHRHPHQVTMAGSLFIRGTWPLSLVFAHCVCRHVAVSALFFSFVKRCVWCVVVCCCAFASCSSVHGDHNRYLFTRTESDQTRWLDALRAASRTEPFEEKFTLGVRLVGRAWSIAWCHCSVSAQLRVSAPACDGNGCAYFCFVQRELGTGRFSKVFDAVCIETGDEFAVKIINKADLKEVRSGREWLTYCCARFVTHAVLSSMAWH